MGVYGLITNFLEPSGFSEPMGALQCTPAQLQLTVFLARSGRMQASICVYLVSRHDATGKPTTCSPSGSANLLPWKCWPFTLFA